MSKIIVLGVTACKSDEKISYINDLISSVNELEVPSNIEFKWSILINGPKSSAYEHFCKQRIIKKSSINWIKNKLTPGLARNIIARSLYSDYLLIIDSDDYSMPNRLERIIDIAKSQQAAVVYSKTIPFNDRNLYERVSITLRDNSLEHKKLNPLWLYVKSIPRNPSALIKTKDFFLVNGYDEVLTTAEDYCLWCKLHKAGKTFTSIKSSTVLYRQNDTDYLKRRGKINFHNDINARRILTGRKTTAILLTIIFSSYKLLPKSIFLSIYKIKQCFS